VRNEVTPRNFFIGALFRLMASRKYLSRMNLLAIPMLAESGSVEIQARGISRDREILQLHFIIDSFDPCIDYGIVPSNFSQRCQECSDRNPHETVKLGP
jgi:hypothetical protein